MRRPRFAIDHLLRVPVVHGDEEDVTRGLARGIDCADGGGGDGGGGGREGAGVADLSYDEKWLTISRYVEVGREAEVGEEAGC
jgi:hypothetical protein